MRRVCEPKRLHPGSLSPVPQLSWESLKWPTVCHLGSWMVYKKQQLATATTTSCSSCRKQPCNMQLESQGPSGLSYCTVVATVAAETAVTWNCALCISSFPHITLHNHREKSPIFRRDQSEIDLPRIPLPHEFRKGWDFSQWRQIEFSQYKPARRSCVGAVVVDVKGHHASRRRRGFSEIKGTAPGEAGRPNGACCLKLRDSPAMLPNTVVGCIQYRILALPEASTPCLLGAPANPVRRCRTFSNLSPRQTPFLEGTICLSATLVSAEVSFGSIV